MRISNDDIIDIWQSRTERVTADAYRRYFTDGKTRRLAALAQLERAFDKVLREVRATEARDAPAVWSLYNMGVVVKTRESVFSIDVVHRRAARELAPLLDFALVTHNHADHFTRDFYDAMNGAGKTVVSNFLDNYGVHDWRREGGFRPGESAFSIRDVEIRTSLVDHNDYLVDFTTAFEIKAGGWSMYHSGDCGSAAKLGTAWGRPDLWMFFPGCGVDVGKAVRRIRPRRLVFGHLWELAHSKGRLDAPLVRAAVAAAESAGATPVLGLWGDRII